MRVGYLGPPGTHTEEAVKSSPGSACFELMPLETVYDTVLAVQEGAVERALVPIENSTEGSVNATLDALALETTDVVITGEVVHAIDHCLVARTQVPLETITTVVSHPQATAQCAHFLRAKLPRATVLPASSTADAVRRLAQSERGDSPTENSQPPDGRESARGEPGRATSGRGSESSRTAGCAWAALGNRSAAERYGCVVLRESVQDRADNETRFVWLARRGAPHIEGVVDQPSGISGPQAWKSSLVFWGVGADTPGWLVRCLSEFAFRGVNLTRIESRPRKRGLGAYMFFADVEGSAADPTVAEAIEALRGQAQEVRVLGSYPAAG
ncbi:MAG: prephenate dehydratase [Actinomycetota bacterium]|nr:prephenate dehydratase [Actinomycetota bacterium]